MEHFDLLPKSEIQAGYGLIIITTCFGLWGWFSVFSCLFSKKCRQYFAEISRSWGMSFRVERTITTIMSIVCLLVYTFYIPFIAVEIPKSGELIQLVYLKPKGKATLLKKDLSGYEIYHYETLSGTEKYVRLIIHTKEGKRYMSQGVLREEAEGTKLAGDVLSGFLPELPSKSSESDPQKWYQPWLENTREKTNDNGGAQ